jgi:carbonic anhydrase/acetyltransferase-like protein (isoleucine patch superfamily)
MLHLTRKPDYPDSCFVAPSADLIGNVVIGERSSVWFQSVLRADVMPIEIGDETNIQDGTIIHGSLNKAQTRVGNGVTVGHKVILHGCTIEDDCLIGMGAVIMDNATIPKNSIVAAGSLVTENAKFEEGMLILGSPAKQIRPLKKEELNWIKSNAKHYIRYAESYRTGKDPLKNIMNKQIEEQK